MTSRQGFYDRLRTGRHEIDHYPRTGFMSSTCKLCAEQSERLLAELRDDVQQVKATIDDIEWVADMQRRSLWFPDDTR